MPIARPLAFVLAAALGVVGWAFWPTFEFLVAKWTTDPQYSHGFLVPVVSAYLLWRANLAGRFANGISAPLTGSAILTVAIGARWLAGGLLFHQLDALALLLTLSGLALIAGGWTFARASLPALLFLGFMIPLPYEVERNLGGSLKDFSTTASTYVLQTLGLPAVAEGHVILIDDVRLGVVDACSGLKMLMTFAAFAVGAALTLDRTKFEKLCILLGIIPIAVVVNVLRIAATGVAYTLTPNKATLDLAHDVHGWLMMPVGLGLLAVQLWCLSRLVVKPETALVELPAPRLGFAV